MKMRLKVLAALTASLLGAALLGPANASVAWTPWSVGPGASTTVNGDGSVTFSTADANAGAQVWDNGVTQLRSKAYYSTDAFNGMTIGQLGSMTASYNLLSATPAGVNGLNGPYMNIIVTDGLGNFSILLLDADPAPFGQQRHVFGDPGTSYKFNESTGGVFNTMQGDSKNTNFPSGSPTWGFDDVKDFIIAAGLGAAAFVAPFASTFCTVSAAGCDDGIILAQGNRGSTPITEAIISNATVPEPGTLALLGLSLFGLSFARRRKQ